MPPPFDRDAKPRGWPVYACGQNPRILVAHVENGMQALLHGPFTYRRATGCLELQPDTPVVWKSGGGNSPLSRVVGLSPDEPCLPEHDGPGEALMSLVAVDH